jgi:hypothetical protein
MHISRFPPQMARVSENELIEERNAVALGYRGRAVVYDLAVGRGKHDLHVNKGDGQFLRIERSGGKQLVKVSRGYYLWAVGAAREQMFQDSSKETRTVCVRIESQTVRKEEGVSERGKDASIITARLWSREGDNTSLQPPFPFRTRLAGLENAP